MMDVIEENKYHGSLSQKQRHRISKGRGNQGGRTEKNLHRKPSETGLEEWLGTEQNGQKIYSDDEKPQNERTCYKRHMLTEYTNNYMHHECTCDVKVEAKLSMGIKGTG